MKMNGRHEQFGYDDYATQAAHLASLPIVVPGHESDIISGRHASYMITPHGQLPLKQGQILAVPVTYSDGTEAHDPVWRYVGADKRVHDLTQDEHGQLPPVVAQRLERIFADIPSPHTQDSQRQVTFGRAERLHPLAQANTQVLPIIPPARAEAKAKNSWTERFMRVVTTVAQVAMFDGFRKPTGRHHARFA